MKIHSIWKNVMLLTIGSFFVFQSFVASANSDTTTSTSGQSGEEECVITEDHQ